MVVYVTVTDEDIDTVRQALGYDKNDSYFDWKDPDSVGEAIETLIQQALKDIV